jgi:cytoskeletal protein CcmA (bactofilin family)
MPVLNQDRCVVTCPRCGHKQPGHADFFPNLCRSCGHRFLSGFAQETVVPQRTITCFDCGVALRVALGALSTLCKKCSSHIDLRDYHIASSLYQRFKTQGKVVIAEEGCVHDTNAMVGEAVILGTFIGKLTVERTLTIYPDADIQGTFKAGKLVIPENTRFRWPELIRVGAAEVSGELAADLKAEALVWLKATARFFGHLQASRLVVEPGAAFVGVAEVGVGKTASLGA